MSEEIRFETVTNGETRLRVAVTGRGPLILCVHGWPELWYSWRYQLPALAKAGYTVAALDVRGYGGSSRPHPVDAYTLRELAGDVKAVIDQLGAGAAILIGHDWGAPIVWNTALLHPGAVRAVAGLSVPWRPPAAGATGTLHDIYEGRFFYQTYFQAEGTAEAELEADVRDSLWRVYWALSGDAPLDKWIEEKPADARLLDGLDAPTTLPAWLQDEDLDVYAAAFTASGFRGPINRYRASKLDGEDLIGLAGAHIAQPACFIAGECDVVRHFVPGLDLYEDPGAACDDFRGATLIAGAGHWVQQEAADATNDALLTFLRSIE